MGDRDRDEGVKLFVYGVSSSCPKDLLESEFGKLYLYKYSNGRAEDKNLKVKIAVSKWRLSFSIHRQMWKSE